MHEQWTLVSGAVGVAPPLTIPGLGGAAGVLGEGQPAPIKAHLAESLPEEGKDLDKEKPLCFHQKGKIQNVLT